MANITLIFRHATGSEIEAEVDDTWTSSQVIQALVEERFVPPVADANRNLYQLTLKGNTVIAEGQTLAQSNVQNNDVVTVSLVERGGSAPQPRFDI